MADKVRLSKTTVATIQPTGKDFTVWDCRLPGFGLRVRASGSKSFIYSFRSEGGRAGIKRRVTIDATNPEVAFERAKELAGQHLAGIDPVEVKAKRREELIAARLTPKVGQVLDQFIERHGPNLSANTRTEYSRLVERMLKPALGDLAIDALEPRHVAAAYASWRDRPTTGAGAIRVLSSAMGWAEEAGLRPPGPNPARIRLKSTRRRERLFSDGEVNRMMAATDKLEADGRINPVVALAIRLLFSTGGRAGEVTGLKWSGVDFETSSLTWPNSKTGFLQKPMTAEAAALLKAAPRIVGCAFVCPSETGGEMPVSTVRKGFRRVMAEAGVEAGENASLHLVRHWFASKTYTDPDLPMPVAMAVVGHTNISTAARYSHVSRDQVLAAAQAAADRRSAKVRAAAGESGKVVKIREE